MTKHAEGKYLLLDSLSQTILYADTLLEGVAEKGGHTVKEVICFALFRQLLEQVDGIFISVDHSNLDLARASLRNAFETQLAIEYIFQDPALLIDRALSYKVGSMNQDIEWFEIAIQQKTLEPEVQETELIAKKTFLEAELNSSDLSNILNEWNRTKAALSRNGMPKWYSLFGGPKSIFQLAKHLGLESEYKNIYGGLSATTHGTNALKNVTLELNTCKVLILPLRDEDRDKEETPIRLGRSFLLNMISLLIKNYENQRKSEFGSFLDEHIKPTRS